MRRGEELERGGGDDAERAFAADKELADVVAGGVFVQRGEVGEQAAVGQHHFQPEHQIARGAVAHHVQPAGIAGDVAADLAASATGKIEREKTSGLGSGSLNAVQHAARIGSEGVVYHADAADFVEPRQVQHNAARRHAAAHQPCVAALRGNRDAVSGAETNQFLHLRHAFRLHHEAACADVTPALVGQKRGLVGGDGGGRKQRGNARP